MMIPDGMFMGQSTRYQNEQDRNERSKEINKKKAKQSFAKAKSKRKKR